MTPGWPRKPRDRADRVALQAHLRCDGEPRQRAIALFIRFIDGFRVFDNLYVLIGPGPGSATMSMSIYIYEAFFRAGDIGRALAAALILFGVAFLTVALALRWLVLGVAALTPNIPLLATLATAFKIPAEITANPGPWVQAPALANFQTVLTISDRLNVWQHLGNSLAAALIGAILPIIVSFPMARAMARRGVGQGVLFPLVINLRAMPRVIFAIPLYVLFRALALLDTQIGLGLILAIVTTPLALLLLLQAQRDLPLELESSGADGWCGLGPPPHPRRPAALPPGDHHLIRVRLFHRMERIPVRPDADHAGRGADDGGRVVLFRGGRRGRAMGRGGGGRITGQVEITGYLGADARVIVDCGAGGRLSLHLSGQALPDEGSVIALDRDPGLAHRFDPGGLRLPSVTTQNNMQPAI